MGMVLVSLEPAGDYWLVSVYVGEAGRRRAVLSAFVSQKCSAEIARLAPSLVDAGRVGRGSVERLAERLDEFRSALNPDKCTVISPRLLPSEKPSWSNVQCLRKRHH